MYVADMVVAATGVILSLAMSAITSTSFKPREIGCSSITPKSFRPFVRLKSERDS